MYPAHTQSWSVVSELQVLVQRDVWEHALCMASWGHERFGRRTQARLDGKSIMPLWRGGS